MLHTLENVSFSLANIIPVSRKLLFFQILTTGTKSEIEPCPWEGKVSLNLVAISFYLLGQSAECLLNLTIKSRLFLHLENSVFLTVHSYLMSEILPDFVFKSFKDKC